MKNSDLKLDDRVSWSYEHHLNAKAVTLITKHGRFLRIVNHRRPYYGELMAWVWWDGNKHPSKVPLWQLEREEENGERS